MQQAEHVFFLSSSDGDSMKPELQKHGSTIWFMNQFKYRTQQLVMHVDFSPWCNFKLIKEGFISRVMLCSSSPMLCSSLFKMPFGCGSVLWVINSACKRLLQNLSTHPLLSFWDVYSPRYLHSTVLMNSCTQTDWRPPKANIWWLEMATDVAWHLKKWLAERVKKIYAKLCPLFRSCCRTNDDKQANWRSHAFRLCFLKLHSSLWVCKKEGSLDGCGLKMEKTL